MKKLKAPEPVESKSEEKKEMEPYELDQHVDTLVKAHEIMADKDLHEKVKAHADSKAKKLTSLTQLRAKAKELHQE